MSKPETVLRYGIEMYVGRPGAGKSLVAVRKLLKVVQEERRVVYTNLPLKWRVVRRWLQLRGGDKLAGLIRPLREDHFNAFIKRFSLRHLFVDEAQTRGVHRRAAVAQFNAEHGPNVVDGPGANWIPAGALIVIDEVQHWFPNPALRTASHKPEPPYLGTYLQMHRHMLHWIWILTQAERQVSPTWKSLYAIVWEVVDFARERFVWHFQLCWFGITACRYRSYTPADWNDGNPRGFPVESFTILPGLPWNRWMFRLYSSFTHAGDLKELQKELAMERVSEGLTEDGQIVGGAVQATRPRRSWKRAGLLLAFVMAVGLFSFVVGRGVSVAPKPQDASGDAVVIVGPDVKLVMQTRGPSPRFSDGSRPRVGERWNNGTVMAATDDGIGCAGDDGWYYQWLFGKGGTRVCRVEEVCGFAERIAADRSGPPEVGSPGPD